MRRENLKRMDDGSGEKVRNPYRFQEGDSFWTGHGKINSLSTGKVSGISMRWNARATILRRESIDYTFGGKQTALFPGVLECKQKWKKKDKLE